MKPASFGLALWLTFCAAGWLPVRAEEKSDRIHEAAVLDGVRKIMTAAARARITPKATVRDFLNQDPGLPGFVRNLVHEQVTRQQERSFHDGSVEVDVLLKAEQFSDILLLTMKKDRFARIRSSWPEQWFADFRRDNKSRIFVQTGTAKNLSDALRILHGPQAAPHSVWRRVKPVGLEKAKRAATQSAYHAFYERIENLFIGKDLRLKEVLSRKTILDYLRVNVRNVARVVPGSLRYTEDLVCEIDMEIPAAAIVGNLEWILTNGVDAGFSRRFKGGPLNRLLRTGGRKLFRVTGSGYPPDEFMDKISPHRPAWARQVLTAEGVGVPPSSVPSEAAAESIGYQRALDDAMGKLRGEIRSLRLVNGRAVGDLLKGSRISTLNKVLLNCRIRDLGFGSSPGYKLQLELDLWKVWMLIRRWD